MQQKVAADIAVPVSDYPHIPDSLTLIEAMKVIKSRGWEIKTLDGRCVIPRAILVFNKSLEFVGMVRRRDIMRGLLPAALAGKGPVHREAFREVEIDPDIAELSYDRTNEDMRKRSSRLISEVMIPIMTINHDDHLIKALHQMVKSNVSRLAVIKEGKVIGVLRSVDILLEIEKMLGVGEEQSEE